MKTAALIRALAGAALFMLAAETRAQLTGTLFTQPDEREYLDYLREEFLRNSAENGFNIEETAIPEIPAGEVVAPAGPTEFSFGGIMARRDGSRSVWLNGRLLAESELPPGISVAAGERSAALRIAHEGNIYVLRPGQSVDLVAGTVMENFQRPAPAAEATEMPSPEAAPAPGANSSGDARAANEAEESSLASTAPEAADLARVDEASREKNASAAATDAPDAAATEPAADSILNDDVDGAVARLTDAEAAALAAALARRQAAETEAGTEAATGASDEP